MPEVDQTDVDQADVEQAGVDRALERLEAASSDDERLAVEAELLVQGDNRPDDHVPEEAEDPGQEAGPAPGQAPGAHESIGGGVTKDKVLARARSQLGITESPMGSNRTKYTSWYGMVGPWCAMFVSWVFHQEGLPLPATTSLGFAYTPSGAAWFKKQDRWTTKPAPGHVVFFDFIGRISHVGIVESVRSDGSIVCIEGNTDEAGGRTGGKVMRKVRRSRIVGYGIPRYGAGSALDDGMLREGSRGAEVVAWQKMLREATGADVAADGDFGPKTLAATKAFQQAQGLEVDGVVGPATQKRMREVIAAKRGGRPPVVAIPPFPGRMLEVVTEGPFVKTWQAQMRKRGSDLTVDGEYGPQSRGACEGLQRDQRLEVDGVVGPVTWKATWS